MKRLNSHQRGYDARWKKAREQFLMNEPLCRHCMLFGIVTPATNVDHIKPHKGDSALFWATENWQPLCHACHSKKTAQEDGGLGNKVGDARIVGGKADGYPVDPNHHWNKK